MAQDERKNWEFLANLIAPTGWMPVEILLMEEPIDSKDRKTRLNSISRFCRDNGIRRKKSLNTTLVNISDFASKSPDYPN